MVITSTWTCHRSTAHSSKHRRYSRKQPSNDYAAYYYKGNALKDLKRYEETLAAYDQAIRFNPHYAAAYTHKGDALAKLGKSTEAQRVYAKARQLGYQS